MPAQGPEHQRSEIARLPVPSTSIRAVETDTAAIVIAPYQTEQNFTFAFKEVEKLKSPLAKARTYFSIAQGLLWAGKNPDAALELTRLNLSEYREKTVKDYSHPRKMDRDAGLSDMATATYELIRLANLTISRGADPTPIIEEARKNISDYTIGIETVPDTNDHRLPAYLNQSRTQVASLTLLAEFVVANPEATGVNMQDLVTEMQAIISEDSFRKYSSATTLAKALSELARVQIFIGDLTGAQASIDQMKGLEERSNTPGQAENTWELTSHKVGGLALLGAVQARVSREFPLEALTRDQKAQILSSDNPQAIIALGFNMDLEEAEALLSGNALSPFAAENLLLGMEEKTKQEEQQAKTRRELLESRRRNLPPKEE